MVTWNPRDHMDGVRYILFKLGMWVSVDTVPEWVHKASDPPKKTAIPANGSVEAVFSGNSLEYKVITKRLPRGAGTYTVQEYAVRIKGRNTLFH